MSSPIFCSVSIFSPYYNNFFPIRYLPRTPIPVNRISSLNRNETRTEPKSTCSDKVATIFLNPQGYFVIFFFYKSPRSVPIHQIRLSELQITSWGLNILVYINLLPFLSVDLYLMLGFQFRLLNVISTKTGSPVPNRDQKGLSQNEFSQILLIRTNITQS